MATPRARLPVTPAGSEFRKVLGCYPTGVAVIATRERDGTPVGLTCNSFTSVSLSPPLVLWCLALYSPSLPAFLHTLHFSINILGAGQAGLSRRFSSPVADRFEGVAWDKGIGNVPLLAGCAAHIECRNETRHYSGDHVIFIGHALRVAASGIEPLVFAGGRYGSVEYSPPV